jgi:putative MATE family efflux protein
MVKKEMATTSVFGLYFSMVITILGILFATPLLHLLLVPDEILSTTTIYLRLTFLGAPFTYFYNALASALKSVGDSKTPLKFLAFAAVLNGVLDVFFIGFLGFGIVCSALTTVFAQAISAILCIIYVYRKIPVLQLSIKEFKIHPALLKQTLKYGSITALQQSCQPIGKLLIQGAINPMGVTTIAAFNAVNLIDDYAFTPEQSISHGMTTFIAQNRGANENDRIKKGLKTGLFLEFCYWIIICLLITLFKDPLLQLFSTKGDRSIITIGGSYLGLMAVFYIFPAFTNGMQGYFRGMGRMKTTLIGTIIQTSLRVLFVYLLAPILGMVGVAYACAIGWICMLIFEYMMYYK